MPRPPRRLSVQGNIKDLQTLTNVRALIEEVNNANDMIEALKKEVEELKKGK